MRCSLVFVALIACEQPPAVAPPPPPAVTPKLVVVTATLPGAEPETIEANVAAPLERAFDQIAHLVSLRARSTVGRVDITLELAPGTEPFGFDRDVMTAIRSTSALLPQTMPSPPTFRNLASPGAVLRVAVRAHDGVAARAWADAAAQKLEQISGVAAVAVCGGARLETTVAIDPARLQAGSASLAEVAAAVEGGGTDAHALAALPAVRDVATVTVDHVPYECRAADAIAPDVVAIDVFAREDRDAVRTRVAAAIPPPTPGIDVDVLPDRVVALAVASGDLAAIRGLLAQRPEVAKVLLEQGTTDDLERPIDSQIVRIAVALRPGADIGGIAQALAGRVVLDRSQTIVELHGADRAALQRFADELAPALHVVAPDRPVQANHVVVDRDRAAMLGVSASAIDDALFAAFGGRRFTSFAEPRTEVVLRVPGEMQDLLAQVWVRGTGDQRIPLSAIVRVETSSGPAALLDVGPFPAIDLRVADAAPAIRAALAAHPLPAGVTLELRAPE